MKHTTFSLAGDDLQIFECFPFVVITDCDGTELVYIRKQIYDDSKCDVIYCSMCIYQYANWTLQELQLSVESYCINSLKRQIDTVQHTSRMLHPCFDLSDYFYGVNQLKRLLR